MMMFQIDLLEHMKRNTKSCQNIIYLNKAVLLEMFFFHVRTTATKVIMSPVNKHLTVDILLLKRNIHHLNDGSQHFERIEYLQYKKRKSALSPPRVAGGVGGH